MLGADFTGTWKLNTAKSKQLQREFATYTMKVEQVDPDNYRIVYDGAQNSGEKVKLELVANFDGKEHAGPAPQMTGVGQHSDPFTWTTSTFRDKKFQGGITAVVSPDNKTMTASVKGVRPDGTTVEEIYFWERE